MAADTEVLTAEALLAHERLVRAVARDLLHDEHAVQDVVQDTWLRALRAGPRALVALPPDLGEHGEVASVFRRCRREGTRRLRPDSMTARGPEASRPSAVGR